MDINESTKVATSLAKEGKFDEAIDLLKKIILEMPKVGGFSKSNYTKIIPYFQKSNRYYDGISYSEDNIIFAIEADCRKTFGHKCKEIQQAFHSIGISEVYDKLRLCAKREGIIDDETKYKALSLEAYEKYSKLLKIGEKIELEKEFDEANTLFGTNKDKWPAILLKKFDSLIKG